MRGDWVEEVREGRFKAHLKHGENSIEAVRGRDPRWLSILVEEVGEVAHALTYDAQHEGSVEESVRAELIDVLCVASAWVDALDAILLQQHIAAEAESIAAAFDPDNDRDARDLF